MAQSTKQYFRDFFREKEINSTFTIIAKNGTTHIYEKNAILAEILSMPNDVQRKLRTKFVQIDYSNGDINRFIEYSLQGLIDISNPKYVSEQR